MHVGAARSAMVLASQRWPGVESALGLYDHLIAACLRVYDTDKENKENPRSPSAHESSISSSLDASTPSSQSSPLSSSMNSAIRHHRLVPRSSPSTQRTDPERHGKHRRSPDSESESFQSSSEPSINPHDYDYFPEYQNDHFDETSLYNTFPPLLPSLMQPEAMTYSNSGSYLGPIGEQYSQYMHAPYVPQQALKHSARKSRRN